jgi:preprotein translocase subunit SecG
MNIALNFTLTLEEYQHFNIVHRKAKATYPGLRKGRSRSFLYWILVLSVAVFVFVLFHQPAAAPLPAGVPAPVAADASVSTIFLTLLPYLLIFIFVWLFFLRKSWLTRYVTKKVWKQNPNAHQPQDLLITDAGITVIAPTVKTEYAWAHFTHFYESDQLFLLYTGTHSAQIICKRAFQHAADMDAFRQRCLAVAPTTLKAYPVQMNETPAVVE